MNDLQNLSNLKRNRDTANQEFLDALERVRKQLPEGVTLNIDEGTLNAPQEVEVTITSKAMVKVGDTLRYRGQTQFPLVHGDDYPVIEIDGCNDPRIACEGFERFDTYGKLSQFKIVRTGGEEGAWEKLTYRTRGQLKAGDQIRFSCEVGGVTLGKVYTITEKPDLDGRFNDDDGDQRDTYRWTHEPGHDRNFIEFRSV